MDIDPSAIRLKHPFTSMIVGPTSSGKTVLTRNILKHFKEVTTINKSSLNVIWCYGQFQENYKKDISVNVNVEYREGLVDENYLKKIKPDIVVVDDLMKEVGGKEEMSALFTKVSHHLNISVIFIVQNLFHKGKEMRDISINTHYFFLLKNPRDRSQIQCFGRQLYPSSSKFFLQAYDDATKKAYSYLLVDLNPQCPDPYRLRSRVISSETIKGICMPIIYLEK